MSGTRAVDVVVGACRLLTAGEQEQVAQALRAMRLEREVQAGDRAAQLLAPLVQLAAERGGAVAVTEYREIRAERLRAGERLPAVHELLAVFGSWRQVKEAV